MTWWTPVRRRLAGAELLTTLLYLPHAPKAVIAPFDTWTHLFFASHYLFGWWTTTDHRWYLGMDTTTYPPLAHQLLAAVAWPLTQVFSMVTALELAYIILAFVLTLVYPLGIYAFASTLVEPAEAALAAIAGALFTGWWMMLFGYGQFPTLIALMFMLFGARALGAYLTNKRRVPGVLAVLLTAMVALTHHFSTISILPVVYGMVVLKHLYVGQQRRRTIVWRAATIAIPAIAIAIAGLYPFVVSMLEAADNPIIPHGSRTPWQLGSVVNRVQFWHVLLSGGLFLTITPIVAWLVRRRRILVASTVFPTLFGLLSLGFTTPLPRLIYGSLAAQLTYYRFAGWGGFLLLPALGGALNHVLENPKRTLSIVLIVVLVLQGVVATQMTETRYTGKSMDRRAEVQEIATILNTGENSRGRYLALGMAQELGAIAIQAPRAQTIDGGYHRARSPSNVPHLLQSGTPQLANAKFERWGRDGRTSNGMPTLTFYLENKNEYHLKYVFSVDPYYEPFLRKHGYELLCKCPELEIRAWYAPDVPPMDNDATSAIVSNTPWYAYLWGTIPLATFMVTLIVAAGAGYRHQSRRFSDISDILKDLGDDHRLRRWLR